MRGIDDVVLDREDPRRRGRRHAAPRVAGAVVLLAALLLTPIVGGHQASAAGAIAYPDLVSIIPTSKLAITEPGDGTKQFQYEHIVFDAGDGPLDILPTDYDSSTNLADGIQRLYSYDASGNKVLQQSLPVKDQFFFHVAHGHYHFPLASFGLYAPNPDGSVGQPVAISPKNGFCIADSVRVDPTLPHSPANIGAYNASCAVPTNVRGIDPGWGDLYDRRDPGQSIDITGVPDGTYWFRAVADPDDNFVESNKANNTTDIKLQIKGDTVTPISPLMSQGAFNIDQSFVVNSTGAGSTPAFSTSSTNELLVALVSADGGPASQTTTVSGGGLSWTLAKRTNAQIGTTEVWTAPAPNKLTNAVVTSTPSTTGFDQAMSVFAIKGASGIGAVAGASGATGAPSVPITTTAPGSWVLGVGDDPDHYTPHDPAAGQEIIEQSVNETTSDSSWMQAPPSPTPTAGTTVTLADTNPVADHWNMTGIELLPAASNDTTPPVISAPSVNPLGPDRATVNWTTDEPASSQVDYGTTPAFGQSTTLDPTLLTAHSQTFTGLSPNTTYTARVHSTDSSGNQATSPNFTFTTTAPRTAPPIFTNVHINDLEPDQATFAWTTDEQADSQVEFGATNTYGSASARDPNLVTAHFLVVTGLTPSTTYHYRVDGTDPYGNAGGSTDFTFTTPALPPPISVDKSVSKDGRGTVTTDPFSTVAPGELLVAYVGTDGPNTVFQTATVSGGGLTWSLVDRENNQNGTAEVWQATASSTLSNASVSAAVGVGTFDLSLTVVAYQGAAGIGNAVVASGAGAGTFPSATFDMNGFNSVVYAVGTDWDAAKARTLASGQSMVHQDVDQQAGTFWVQALNGPAGPVETPITMAAPAPTGDQWDFVAVEIIRPVSVTPVAPTISGVGTSGIGTTAATVSWATDQPSSSKVDYGLTTAYTSSTTLDPTAVTSHSQALSGLTPGTTYHYRVESGNGIGLTVSGDATFTTSSGLTNQTITFGALSGRTLAQSPLTVSATASSGLAVTFTTTTPAICTAGGTNGATITLSAVGTCTVVANQAGNASFAAAPAVSRSFAVSSSASGPISVDTTVFVDGHGAVTTPAFSTASPGDLLVAFVSADGPTSATQTSTVSGGGLTWTLVRRANTQFGTAEVWQATASSALTNATVTSTLGKNTFDQSLTVVAFQGAAGVGNSVGASAASGAPSVGLTTTQAGSWVFGVGNDWTKATARTVAAGQSLVHQFVDTASGDTMWTQSLVSPTPASGTLVTLADTAPTGDRFNLAALEILPSGAPTAPAVFGVGTSGITTTSATVTWATDQAASSQIDYGLTATYGSSTTLDPTAVTSHSQVLGGLTAGTTYHFRVRSSNGNGSTTSGDFTFATAAGPAAQTISFGALPARTLAQSPVTVSATASSGLAVTFSTTTSAVCTAGGTNGATITLVGVGTCTVKADQAGNASFTAAASVSQSFAVTNPASGGLAVDKTVFVNGRGNQTTSPFSTTAPGELLVAFVAADGPTSGGQTSTVSGAALTWTLARRTNTQFGTADVWTAPAGSALTNTTVTSTLGKTGFDQSLTVVAFKGASGVGAVGGSNGASGAPSASLTTTRAGSWVFGVGNDWDKAVGRTPAAGQSLVNQFVDSSTGDTFWVQSTNATTATSGTVVTLGDTAPTTDRFNFSLVEILAS